MPVFPHRRLNWCGNPPGRLKGFRRRDAARWGFKTRKSEIGRILHLKVESGNLRSDGPVPKAAVRSKISTFHFEMQDSSDFRFLVFSATTQKGPPIGRPFCFPT